MPRYLAVARLNEKGASDLMAQGFAARTEQFRELVEGQGGTLEGYWFGTGTIVSVLNYPDAQNFALVRLQGLASGSWLAHAEIQEIHDGAEMDAALAAQTEGYVPPGG
jgi:hypothetical protein